MTVRPAHEPATRSRRWAPLTVASLFTLSGTVHLIKPSVFAELIPQWMPAPTAVIYASGVAELVCAYGLFTRRRWAGPASAGLLLAVWPGNLTMAIDATRDDGLASATAVITWLRMPLQIPLIWMALQDRPTDSPANSLPTVGREPS